jgi:hypothetical protein
MNTRKFYEVRVWKQAKVKVIAKNNREALELVHKQKNILYVLSAKELI